MSARRKQEAFDEGPSTLVSLDCSWPLHCPISRKEGRTTLHVAVDKEGAMMDGVPSFRGLPFFQTQGLQPLAQGAADPPCGPFSRPGSACAHGPLQLQADAGREHFFQALKEEPLFKRLHSECAALPGGEGSLLSLPFPRKHWTIVNCHHFMSSWWEEDGTCVGINEEFFENMERVGSNKLFKTDCMKSFVCQLSLYRFSKAHQDVLTSLCLTTLLREKPPVCVLSKLQFCCSLLFKRDSPHLLGKMKRRVGVKSASRQGWSLWSLSEACGCSVWGLTVVWTAGPRIGFIASSVSAKTSFIQKFPKSGDAEGPPWEGDPGTRR